MEVMRNNEKREAESSSNSYLPEEPEVPVKPVPNKKEAHNTEPGRSEGFIKPTKRPSKNKEHTPVETSYPRRDEHEWFKTLINDTEKEATTSSYFPEVAAAPPPETDVYSDDDIIDDVCSEDEYDKYVLEE